MKQINAYRILVGLAFFGQLVWGQMTTGTISGTVKDASGAVIPGATVSLKNLDTGLARTLTTNSQGQYQAPNLSLGNYEVLAEMPGFQTVVRRGIHLTVGREAVVDFSLNPGTIAEAVTVTAEAPIVETTKAALSGLVDDKSIRDLPLNGRSFDQLVLLQVGVVEGRRGGEASFTGGGAKISISGARPWQNSFLLDGTDVNDSRNAMPGSASGALLGVETVREFRVLTNAYGAEYGRASGGVIIAVTRSGTNELHGTVFEFLRNSALDARNFFDRDPANPTVRSDPPPLRRNQFGFTLGGPIKRDKTFFFGSYEGLRERLGLTTTANVPNESARQGIVPVRGVLTDVGVHPGTRPWLALFPLPNGRDFGDGRGEFIQSVSRSTDEEYFVVRVDHALSANHSFFSRYTFDDAERLIPSALPVIAEGVTSRNQYLTAEFASILSPATLNAFRFGYNRSFPNDTTALDNFPSGLTFVPGVPFEVGGQLGVSGLTTLGQQRRPRFEEYSLFEWSDDVTLTRGAHAMKTGLLIKRVRMFRLLTDSTAGSYAFRSLELFLRGSSRQFQAPMPGFTRDRDWRMTYFGFYVQDDFKVTPKLTLNLGLREEFLTSPVETRGLAANMPDVRMTEPLVGNPFFETFKLNLGPRIGFAWDSRGNAKMVLRGGFGLFYDLPFPTYWRSSGSLVPPHSPIATIVNPPWPNGFDFIDPQKPVFGDIRSENHTGTTYAMQYNLTIQSQITADTALTLGYVGSQGRKITFVSNPNTKVSEILPDGRRFFPANAPRINPIWGDFSIHNTAGNSNYNALVVKVDKRFSRGFQVGGSYTFSKTMSIGETVLGGDFVSGEAQVMDALNWKLDRGQASFNEKHNLSINYSYSLPIERGGAVGKVLNGWQVNGITRISSGAPATISSGCCSFSSPGRRVVDRPNLAAGKSNNPVLGGPDKYFDSLAFELPERGFFGNLGRSTLIGPGLVNFDFSLVKNTAITERTNLQFRAEFFNLFNRANFGDPSLSVFDEAGNRLGNAGQITGTSTTARQIQLALKLTF